MKLSRPHIDKYLRRGEGMNNLLSKYNNCNPHFVVNQSETLAIANPRNTYKTSPIYGLMVCTNINKFYFFNTSTSSILI
jgi:hypothetical protein